MSASAACWPKLLKGHSLQPACEPQRTASHPKPSSREAEGPGGKSECPSAPTTTPPWDRLSSGLSASLSSPSDVTREPASPSSLRTLPLPRATHRVLSPQDCLWSRQPSYYWEPFRIKCTNVGKLQRLKKAETVYSHCPSDFLSSWCFRAPVALSST